MSSLTLEDEMKKIEFEKELEKKNIYIEKLILGFILLVFSIWGTLLIEDFKSDQVREQFLTAKRLEAVTELRDSYIELNKSVAMQRGCLKRIFKSEFTKSHLQSGDQYWINYSKKKNDEINKLKKDYINNIRDFKHKELRHGALISNDFKKHLSYQSSIHIAVYKTEFFQLLDYGFFILDMADHFDVHCRMETGIISDFPKGSYLCEPWSDDLLKGKGYKQFLKEQVKNWNEWKKIHPQIYEKLTFYQPFKKIPVTCGP